MQSNNTNSNNSNSNSNGRRYNVGDLIRESPRRDPPLDVFRVISRLYLGPYFDIYEVYSYNLGRSMECKLIYSPRLSRDLMERAMVGEELRIHRKLFSVFGGHRNIVRPILVTHTASLHILIGTELCSRASLNALARRHGLNTYQIISYFRQLVEAVAFLHNNRIVHRNINLGNALLSMDGSTVKLCGFQYAWERGTPDVTLGGIYGAINYLAPEILSRGFPSSEKRDIWALGCCLYALFDGRPPFESDQQDIEGCRRRILRNEWQFTARFNSVPPEAMDLIVGCLAWDPQYRPSCNEILNHALFRNPILRAPAAPALTNTAAAVSSSNIPPSNGRQDQGPPSTQATSSISNGPQSLRASSNGAANGLVQGIRTLRSNADQTIQHQMLNNQRPRFITSAVWGNHRHTTSGQNDGDHEYDESDDRDEGGARP